VLSIFPLHFHHKNHNSFFGGCETTLLGRKEKKRGKKVILLFSHSLNETGGDMKKEEEGERTKCSRN
jgi:hypothetical protein